MEWGVGELGNGEENERGELSGESDCTRDEE